MVLFFWIIGFVIVILTLKLIFSLPAFRGFVGERYIRRILGKDIEGQKYVLNNVIILKNGMSHQIDHILINRSGIFVIETKNYGGRIYGKDTDKSWKQVLKYGKVKHKMVNPVKQNYTHVMLIKELLNANLPIYSVVVFVRADISKVSSNYVYDCNDLKKIVKEKKLNDYQINMGQMEYAYKIISENNQSKKISNKEHVKNIKKMQENIDNNICPRCGGKLIKKQGEYGDFYGCENYPKCTFKKSLLVNN